MKQYKNKYDIEDDEIFIMSDKAEAWYKRIPVWVWIAVGALLVIVALILSKILSLCNSMIVMHCC